MALDRRVPITIVTGFLGSGKTTLILNLLPQLPQGYRLALLKNEFGDVAIDSQLAAQSAVSGVTELLNGCICCNLVGQLCDALEELRTGVEPDRIVIETSGSAFPATLAMEVNRLAKETGRYVLDGVMSVIDVENWKGYEDVSMTAKVQAQYTDLLILNKHELVSERQLEDCIDRILDLELDVPTPRILSRKGFVDKDVVFGLDARLASPEDVSKLTEAADHGHQHDSHSHDDNHDTHQSEVEVLSVTLSAPEGTSATGVDLARLYELLREAPKDEVYRLKAILLARTTPQSSTGEKAAAPSSEKPGRYILNWAFGRWTFVAAPTPQKPIDALPTPDTSEAWTPGAEPILRMTVMTARGESAKWQRAIERDRQICLEPEPSVGVLTVRKVS